MSSRPPAPALHVARRFVGRGARPDPRWPGLRALQRALAGTTMMRDGTTRERTTPEDVWPVARPSDTAGLPMPFTSRGGGGKLSRD